MAADHHDEAVSDARRRRHARARSRREAARRAHEGVLTGHGEELRAVPHGDHVVAVQRKRVVHRAERLIAHGARLGPGLGPPGRGGWGWPDGGVFEQPVSDRDPRPFEFEPAIRGPAVEVAFSVRVVAQHHHPACPDPLVEERQVSRRQGVRGRLRLASEQEDEDAIPGEVGARQVGIELPVLDGVPRVAPRLRGAAHHDRVGQREVEHEQAARLRLASGDEQERNCDGRTERRKGDGGWPISALPSFRPFAASHCGRDSSSSSWKRGSVLTGSNSGARK